VQAAATGSIIADRYCLLRKLGAGGMGSVWLAHDQSLDSQCAVKLVDPEKAADEEVRIRFEREAKAAAQIRGANVVDIFDHGIWEGTPFIVMEYLEGEDLGARLERTGALDTEQTYQIVSQVARALVRAHAAGIVHRDLKPENIFLVPGDDQEVAKVLDFGIAKHEQYSLAGKTTKTGSFMGTPYYMSPEQARGRAIDWRSDLWALGVIAYQCLNGRPPFESEALGELMGMIIYDPIPPISDSAPGLPGALELWWERAVARDREQRFQSAKELADAFGEAIETSKQMAVPSIAPRVGLPSFSDFDALRSVYPRTPAMPLADQSARFSPVSFADGTPVDEGTDAPVTRSRGSVLPELSSLPRKQRLIVLSLGGAILAVLGFLVIASLRSPPQVSVAAAARPSAAPAVVVTPVPSSKSQPAPIIFDPSSLPLEEGQDKKKKPAVGAGSSAPAARPTGAARDYGI